MPRKKKSPEERAEKAVTPFNGASVRQHPQYDKNEARARYEAALPSKKQMSKSNAQAYAEVATKMKEFLGEVKKRNLTGMNTKVWTDPNELSIAVSDYLAYVLDHGLYPELTGLSLWLGCSHDKFLAIEACGDERSEILKNFRTTVLNIMSQIGMNKEGNPAYQIFMEKSRFGMNDKPELNVNLNINQSGSTFGAATIQDGFIGGIPIDADFEEVED